MNLDTAKIWHAGLFTLRHIASVLLVLGIIGFLAKPHAQTFVREAVDDRIENLEKQMDDVQTSQSEQSQSQAVMSNEIENLSRNQEETRANTRMILQSLQGLRNEIADAE